MVPYITFNELMSNINSVSDIKTERTDYVKGLHIGIRLAGRTLPVSINEAEFNYMRDFIIEHKLVSGYELSTGTGISTIGIGAGFKDTNGLLISFDSYYEELTQESNDIPVGIYSEKDVELIKRTSIGYKFISNILNKFNLAKHVELQIGWSPNDFIKYSKLNNKLFDFVFLDCPKHDEAFERDILSIKPYLKDKFVIFVHDTHGYTVKSFKLIKNLFNLDMNLIQDYYKDTPNYSHRYFPLAIVTNLV